MKKRFFLFALSLILLVTSQVGSVFAESSLEQAANELIGVHYKYGGTTTKGFDCSGFSMYVFKQFGINLPRVSRDQAKIGNAVSKNNLRPGDLLFFNTNGRGISHLGIYLGDGEFIHSSSSNGVIKNKLSQAYYVKRYVTARRILGEADFKEVTADLLDEELDEEIQEEDVTAVAPAVTP
ncbi:MAG TPA: C40 family peptidase [Bacilli bacterium]